MPPRPVRGPTRRTSTVLPEAQHTSFLLEASALLSQISPQLAAVLGRRALQVGDGNYAVMPRGAAASLCGRCGLPFTADVYQSGQVIRLPHHYIKRKLEAAARGGAQSWAKQQANRAAVVYSCKLCGHNTVRPFYTAEAAHQAIQKAGGPPPPIAPEQAPPNLPAAAAPQQLGAVARSPAPGEAAQEAPGSRAGGGMAAGAGAPRSTGLPPHGSRPAGVQAMAVRPGAPAGAAGLHPAAQPAQTAAPAAQGEHGRPSPSSTAELAEQPGQPRSSSGAGAPSSNRVEGSAEAAQTLTGEGEGQGAAAAGVEGVLQSDLPEGAEAPGGHVAAWQGSAAVAGAGTTEARGGGSAASMLEEAGDEIASQQAAQLLREHSFAATDAAPEPASDEAAGFVGDGQLGAAEEAAVQPLAATATAPSEEQALVPGQALGLQATAAPAAVSGAAATSAEPASDGSSGSMPGGSAAAAGDAASTSGSEGERDSEDEVGREGEEEGESVQEPPRKKRRISWREELEDVKLIPTLGRGLQGMAWSPSAVGLSHVQPAGSPGGLVTFHTWASPPRQVRRRAWYREGRTWRSIVF